MSEQGYLPFSEAVHAATEEWGPDSQFGHILTYLLVLAPTAWLAVGWLKGLNKRQHPAQVQSVPAHGR
jgi:hypothetical protein